MTATPLNAGNLVDQALQRGRGTAAPEADATAFETFKASDWEGVPIEPRRWVAHHRIPVGEPGIMSGDGGTGKTKLMQQLGVAVAAELADWVGGVVETHGPVIFYSAEEKLKEMHRRTVDIVDYWGISLGVLNRLHFICDHEDPVLGKIDNHGIVQPALSLLRLEKTVALIRPALVIIENAADVYAGNESDRANVTRFVRSLLGRLTLPSDAAVGLIQHPSVSGLVDGTGRSGTTGWNNAGRWRLYFTTPKGDDGDDDGLRQLEVVKNNYGRKGEKVRLRWEKGVFVPEGSATAVERAAAEASVDDVFMRCLHAKTAQGIRVSPHPGKNSAAVVFAQMPEAQGCNAKGLGAAMERLLSSGRIKAVPIGAPSRQRDILVET